MKITVIFLSYKRLPNLNLIIDSIKANQNVEEIIVFNNDSEYKVKSKYATTINSSKNFGCFAKYTIGQMVSTSHCLSIDDDLILKPDTVNNFIKWSKKYPEAILGYYGMVLDQKSDKPYSRGIRIYTQNIKNAHEVDIVVGKIHFFKTEKLAESFIFRNKVPHYRDKSYLNMEGEDIVLSLSNKLNGYTNYIIPSEKDNSYADISELNVTLSRRKSHMNIRDLATIDLLKLM